MFKIQGVLKQVFAEQIVSEKFKKREFVIEIPDGKWSQLIKMEMIQNNCSFLDNYAAGDNVEVLFSLKGREWTNNAGQKQYFNTIQSFGMVRVDQAKAPQQSNSNKHWSGLNGEIAQDHVDQGLENDMNDGLPF